MKDAGMACAVPAQRVAPLPAPALKTGECVLLALDGRCMERHALPVTLQLCGGCARRLDILVAFPPRPAPSLLAGFLMDLELHGLDYRLTTTDRELSLELVTYVHQAPYVSVVLLDCLDHWDRGRDPVLASLRSQGYRVVSLLDHRRGSRTTFLSAAPRELG